MDPLAKHGIDILFPTSVIYSLYLITDEHTDKTEKRCEQMGYLTMAIL